MPTSTPRTNLAGQRTRARIVQAVAGHHAVLGCCPTLREVAAAVGRCKSNVSGHVQRLIRDGWLEMDSHSVRTLRLARRDGRPAVRVYEQGEANHAD